MSKANQEENQAAALLARIRSLLPLAMLKDHERASQKLRQLLRRSRGEVNRSRPQASTRLLDELSALKNRLEHSVREREERLRRKPAVHYPPALPITAKAREIVRAIKRHPVVMISGETGCGKSTQLPKMCLEAGRGVAGKIGCTQPRRIAAVTIAHRIAEELGETLGRTVGYKIRFDDKTPRLAYIKIMTDGMLLAETQSDRCLFEYDTLIIDEAHERSLNIDFLLGIVKTLLAARPELKVIITSATLDTEKFSRAFGDAPVIQVGGRMYPVEVEYMSAESFSKDIDESDYIDLAVEAVARLKSNHTHGDILIFMPTEQDILETRERLEGKNYAATTILPLYARLPASQQGRVYSVSGPKVVVATNVAETSLTIPGIKYVIDTGLARISQYQPGSRINSLPISLISKASADQRKGRCGRVQEGLCIRLYSEDDYEARPAFTPPEILRSNLAEVILKMIYLDLGHPKDFPFVDKPLARAIKDGYETLLELGAITGQGRDYELTDLGRRMAAMPIDPRISRMLLKAAEEDCLRETAVIASALSIRDPRERPPEKARLADQAQAVFSHPDSDFLTFLNIWDSYYSAEENLSSQSQRKKFCHDHFLSFARLREWAFVHDQIISIFKEQKIPLGRTQKTGMSAALYAGIHRAILSGFLSSTAVHKEKNIYQAAKGREVMIFPGSTLFNKSRPWIVAAEMVRTSRLYARTAAKIDPDWLEELGGDQCHYSYAEPHWDKDRGEVRAKERVTLYGLEIISGRNVAYGPKNPEEAHKIFVNAALVEGQVKDPPAFLHHNQALQERILGMEEKLRRRDIMVDEKTIADFYSQRLAGIFDLRGLEKRLKQPGSDKFLRMTERDLLLVLPDEEELAGYPDELTVGEGNFQLSYKFAPGDTDDGVTFRIPYSVISAIQAEDLDWVVTGYFREKIAALVRGLPKNCRKQLMPISDTVDIIVREMKRADFSLYETLSKFVKRRFQVDIPEAEWARAEIPAHLKMRLAVIDEQGREVAASRNLELLRGESSVSFAPEDSLDWKKACREWEKEGLTGWDFGLLPESILVGPFLVAYPALEAAEKGVNIKLFRTKEEALTSHLRGVAALLEARFGKDIEFLRRYLSLFEEYEKAALFFGGREAVEKGMLENIRKEIFQKNLRSWEELEAYAETVIRSLFEKSHLLRETTFAVLAQHQRTREAIRTIEVGRRSGPTLSALAKEMRKSLEVLVPSNFLEVYNLDRLVHLPRLLKALEIRAERAGIDLEKDRRKAEQARPFIEAADRLHKKISEGASLEKKKDAEEFSWLVEEFKVSLFAPELKTSVPVSPKRLAVKLKEIESLA
jgi:ATP-dependent helicase HrpA